MEVFRLVSDVPLVGQQNFTVHFGPDHVISSVGQQGPVSPNRPVYMVPTVGQQGLATSSRPVHKDHTGKVLNSSNSSTNINFFN